MMRPPLPPHGQKVGGRAPPPAPPGPKPMPEKLIYLFQIRFHFYCRLPNVYTQRPVERKKNGFSGLRKLKDTYQNSITLFSPYFRLQQIWQRP